VKRSRCPGKRRPGFSAVVGWRSRIFLQILILASAIDMANSPRRIAWTLAAILSVALASPAAATDWHYWRANDLKRGGVMLTTEQDRTHSLPISLCAPAEAFTCMRFIGGVAFAVPKGKLPNEWEFEGNRYKLMEREAALGLLGETAEGVYIRTTNSSADTYEFMYSPLRGFFAFQLVQTPQTGTTVFISIKNCAPGAASSCRDKRPVYRNRF